eukprot:2591492-Amphidinium_carterae.1
MEPRTAVNVLSLAQTLLTYNAQQPYFIGRAIKDTEYCIIHHYQLEPPYPVAQSGFAISASLAEMLSKDLEEHPLGGNQQIEPVWELAQWIKGVGVDLTNESSAFCSVTDKPDLTCATWVRPYVVAADAANPDDVIIAVKTVGHFHGSRLPLLEEFWAGASEVQVEYLSNTGTAASAALKNPLVDLSVEYGDAVDPAKESTEQGSGHCSKMQSILRYLWKHYSNKQWFVVTDDDTFLSTSRLLEVLGTHDSRSTIYLGERYGWSHREDRSGGNYITTGGGMALSRPALEALATCESCQCPTADSPDDMTL